MSKRSDFDPTRPVQLKQACFTGNDNEALPVGEYPLDRIPDVAFELNLVSQTRQTKPTPSPALAPKPITNKESDA